MNAQIAIDATVIEQIAELAGIQENVIVAEVTGEITPDQAREVLDGLQEPQ